MAQVPLSYSQSLRAIGQSLEALGIQNFDVRKSGDRYIVDRGHSKRLKKETLEKNFLKSIAQIIWGSADPDQKVEPLVYTSSAVHRLDIDGRSRRGSPTTMPDTHKLSQVLRVVGDYLDRKNTAAFIISRLNHSVTVNYEIRRGEQRRENFRVDSLYDLAVYMYRRRVGRDWA